MLEIELVPLLKDNYAYLLRDAASGKTAIVDPSEAKPVIKLLQQKQWGLDYVLNTHHHYDHSGGNLGLKEATGCQVVGFAGDAERIPGIDKAVAEGEIFALGESKAKILFIPGHTLGHIAYWFAEDHALFCGDTLFSLGCGRLFEGAPEQMYHSLQTLAALPAETRVYCGHEYTLANADFALTIEPDNQDLRRRYEEAKQLRDKQLPTIPSTMGMECKANPFLRATDAKVFAAVRRKKDVF